ncbi:MAG: phosphatase PAP2 family protein [Thermomicrobiales bacterium]
MIVQPIPSHPPAPRAGDRSRWPLSWPAIGILSALFVVLAILAGTVGTLPGDLWISTQIQRLHGQPWRTIWHLGNAFGTSLWVVWFALVGLVVAASLRQWRDVSFLLGLLVLRLAMLPLKTVVQSPRPTASQVHIVQPVDGYGFPSGHTLTATVLFGAMAVLLVRHLPWRRSRPLAISLWAVGVAITGFARIWGGAHWPSDVLGAAILGVVAVAIAAKLDVQRLRSESRKIADHPSREALQANQQPEVGAGGTKTLAVPHMAAPRGASLPLNDRPGGSVDSASRGGSSLRSVDCPD